MEDNFIISDDGNDILQWLNEIVKTRKWLLLKKRYGRFDIYYDNELICYKWLKLKLYKRSVLGFMQEQDLISICCKLKKK